MKIVAYYLEIGPCKPIQLWCQWTHRQLDNISCDGYFDGASIGGHCGCGAIISISHSTIYHFH